jgi:hypothetical protein
MADGDWLAGWLLIRQRVSVAGHWAGGGWVLLLAAGRPLPADDLRDPHRFPVAPRGARSRNPGAGERINGRGSRGALAIGRGRARTVIGLPRGATFATRGPRCSNREQS